MDGIIFLLLAIACESVPGKNDAVLIVCQNVFYVLLKGTARCHHSLLRKLIKALLAAVCASDCALSRNVEVLILRTSAEIAVQIPTRECGVCFSDDSFYWMGHDVSSYLPPGLLLERTLCHRTLMVDRRSWLICCARILPRKSLGLYRECAGDGNVESKIRSIAEELGPRPSCFYEESNGGASSGIVVGRGRSPGRNSTTCRCPTPQTGQTGS